MKRAASDAGDRSAYALERVTGLSLVGGNGTV